MHGNILYCICSAITTFFVTVLLACIHAGASTNLSPPLSTCFSLACHVAADMNAIIHRPAATQPSSSWSRHPPRSIASTKSRIAARFILFIIIITSYRPAHGRHLPLIRGNSWQRLGYWREDRCLFRYGLHMPGVYKRRQTKRRRERDVNCDQFIHEKPGSP
jgi:hypothetical protein